MWWLWFNVKLFRSIALVTLFAKTEKSLISPLLWRAHLDFSDVGLFVRLLKLSLYLSDDQARCRRGWVGSTCPMEVLWSRPQHNSRALLCSGLSGHSRKVGPKKLGFPNSSEIKHKSDFSFRTLNFNNTINFYITRLKIEQNLNRFEKFERRVSSLFEFWRQTKTLGRGPDLTSLPFSPRSGRRLDARRCYRAAKAAVVATDRLVGRSFVAKKRLTEFFYYFSATVSQPYLWNWQ